MKKAFILNCIILLFSKWSLANTLTSSGGEVTFKAVAKPSFLKVNGSSKEKYPAGSVNFENGQANGEFVFNLKDLDTGINLRTEHMKNRYLEVSKYPEAKLTFKGIAIANSNTDLESKFTGSLTLHGETHDVNGTFNYSAKSKKVVANFIVNISEFKIEIPKYLGMVLNESVNVETTILFK